jgi:hypothetical protein
MIRLHRMGAVALAWAVAQGAAQAAVAPEAAQELARKSGLWTQLDSLLPQVRAGMAAGLQRSGGQVTAAQRTKMLDCAQSAYAGEALRATALDALVGTLQPADLTPLLAWYDSPLGRKIATIEVTSSQQTPDPQERLQRGAEALTIASEGRRASLQAIVSETHSVDLMADTLMGLALGVQQGLASADPAASGATIAELKAGMGGRRPQLVAHFAQISVPAYAFTYLTLSDDELKQYADYLGTPAAMAFSDATLRGVSRALGYGSVTLGRCLKAPEAPKAASSGG